mmetsp:Transcript_21835/g.42050  ORF Transcript_21835/g.42050 Transcript_21835/m.42050 type:complete len:782 (+) Transcript_21835:73-2418(+)
MRSFRRLAVITNSSYHVSAWSPSLTFLIPPSSYMTNPSRNKFIKDISVATRSVAALHSAKSNTNNNQIQHYSKYSSAYDKNLPPALVGEAVRSALRSDQGICLDFTTERFSSSLMTSDEVGVSRLVSVVQVQGKGTHSFLNAKFSQSVPRKHDMVRNAAANCGETVQFIRSGHIYETGYLTSKGRIIDRLTVLAFPGRDSGIYGDVEEAFLMTSPGNGGGTLFNELSPLVFPMDRVTLVDCTGVDSSDSAISGGDCRLKTSVITLACSSLKDAQTSFNKNILNILSGGQKSQKIDFPTRGVCHHYQVRTGNGDYADVYFTEHTFLPMEACRGYTILIREKNSTSTRSNIANVIWGNLTDEYNDEGPVGLGTLEYETLRIESGLPGYGFEMTGDGPKKSQMSVEEIKKQRSMAKEGSNTTKTMEQKNLGQAGERKKDQYFAKANPLELHQQTLVDTEKGCYQGQEGVASMLKNKRGYPRVLYQVLFFDAENDFDGNNDGGYGIANMAGAENKEWHQFLKNKQKDVPLINKTRQPQPGDELYVLGSNESIQVGTITSVAEPNGTGDTMTVALALVRRSDSILKSIRNMNLDMPKFWEEVEPSDDEEDEDYPVTFDDHGGSGMLRPPPLDPLHNLEVVVGGTYTIGRLSSVPSRRYGIASSGNAKSDETAGILDYESRGEVVEPMEPSSTIKYEFEKAFTAEDQTAPFQSKPPNNSNLELEEYETDDFLTGDALKKAEEDAAKAKEQAEAAAAEAKRKAEKMEMLKARAEAAMAARRKKKSPPT